MSEKLLAGLVTAAVIAPVCAVCLLGPAVIASIFLGITGWLDGFDTILTAGLVLVAGITIFATIRKRRARRAPAKPGGEVPQ